MTGEETSGLLCTEDELLPQSSPDIRDPVVLPRDFVGSSERSIRRALWLSPMRNKPSNVRALETSTVGMDALVNPAQGTRTGERD